MMKKFLFLAACAGVALVSCVKEQEVTVTPASNQEIRFEVAKYQPSTTRAEVDFPIDKTFGTYGFLQENGSSEHSEYMDNVEISYHVSGQNTFWAAKSGQYFWLPDSHIDFISYAPYNSDATSSAVPEISDDDGQQTLTYNGFKVQQNPPVDLLYSDKAMQQTANTQYYVFTGVPTLFHHALAKLNFQVKALRLDNKNEIPAGEKETKWTTTINSIKIEGIYDEGNLILKTQNDHTAVKTVTWTNSNSYNVWNHNSTSTTSMEWKVDHLLTTTATIYGQGTQTVARDYYILPQLLVDNQQKITVNYTVVTTLPTGEDGSKSHSATVYFNSLPSIDNWELGKNIIYTIEIDPFGDEIHFAPKVVDWEDANGMVSI